MSDEHDEHHSPDVTSSFEYSSSFTKSTARKKSVAFSKRSTDNTQIEQNFPSSQLAKERAIAHEQMLKECSFAPSVRDLPRSYGQSKIAGTLVYNRLTKWDKAREVEIKQKIIQRAHEEIKGCTFKPQINRKGPKYAGEKHATTRLYEESTLIAMNKARVTEELRAKEVEKLTQECTFKPR
jgi:hypothetical protein